MGKVKLDGLSDCFKKYKWIVPPGLKPALIRFEKTYQLFSETQDKKFNLMITGPSGAGKSLFIDVFERLFRKDFPDEKTHFIVRANCAHMGGPNSDPNIARSELFGLTKEWKDLLGCRVSQGKGKNTPSPGLIAQANGGVLVLEEIGELPKEVQAMFLEFIETHRYRLLGGVKEETSSCHVIGSTNSPKNLREDLRYRFFSLEVPPLYKRRIDILYYLAFFAPGILKTLMPYQTLTLLCHNWPGNVREIERAVFHLRLLNEKYSIQELVPGPNLSPFHEYYWDRKNIFAFSFEDSGDTSLDGTFSNSLFAKLALWGVHANLLEKELATRNLGLAISLVKLKSTFAREILFDLDDEPSERFNVGCLSAPAFDQLYEGFDWFCFIFFRNILSDSNLLDVFDEKGFERIPQFKYLAFPHPHKKYNELRREILGFIYRKRVPASMKTLPAQNTREFYNLLNFLKLKSTEPLQPDFTSMTEKQLFEFYYRKLFEFTKGNQSKISRIAGLSKSTINEKLKRLHIS